MRVPQFDLDMSSRLSMHDLEDGQRWVRLFLEHLPRYTPDTWGFPEPYRTPFNPADPPPNLVYGEGGFQQKGRRTLGYFFKPKLRNRVHSSFSFSVKNKHLDWPAIRAFIEICLESMQLDYVGFDTRHDPLATTHMLRKCIPLVRWFLWLGPPYMKLLGDELRRVKIEGGRSEALGPGWVLQLSEDPRDLLTRMDEMEARAASVRAQLPGVFCDPAEMFNHPKDIDGSQYRAPAFELQTYPGIKYHPEELAAMEAMAAKPATAPDDGARNGDESAIGIDPDSPEVSGRTSASG
jgi:hypothetical protein